MIRYLVYRALTAIGVMVIVSVLTFSFTNIAVDPAVTMAGESATAADIQLVRQQYGFDKPLVVQYGHWLGSWLTGDFGMSFAQRRPVATILLERFPVTIALGVFSLALAFAFAIPLGVAAALRPYGMVDRLARGFAMTGMAMPSFWMGLVLILVFGVDLRWLPVSGSSTPYHFILPCVTLAFYSMPPLLRLIRFGMIEVLNSDYIRTARAKGLGFYAVVFRHALRNALIPVVALGAVQLGYLLGGSVVVESVFSVGGVGLLAWDSISAGDLPVVQAIVAVMSFVYVILTFLSDILNAALDPRIRLR